MSREELPAKTQEITGAALDGDGTDGQIIGRGMAMRVIAGADGCVAFGFTFAILRVVVEVSLLIENGWLAMGPPHPALTSYLLLREKALIYVSDKHALK